MTNIKRNILLSLAALTTLSFTTASAKAEYSETAEEIKIYTQELREANAAPKVKNKAKKKQKAKYAGWYMQIKVSATAPNGKVYRHSSAGVFGQLKQSKKKIDKHDIPGYGAAVFQVVFPHYNWGDDSGDYYTDYRKWNKKKDGKRAVWTFQVKNQHSVHLENAPITIELEGLQNVDYTKEDGRIVYHETNLDLEKRNDFTLVDVDNNKTYSIDELENANLTMDGTHKRSFRWVRGEVRKKDFKPVPEPQ